MPIVRIRKMREYISRELLRRGVLLFELEAHCDFEMLIRALEVTRMEKKSWDTFACIF